MQDGCGLGMGPRWRHCTRSLAMASWSKAVIDPEASGFLMALQGSICTRMNLPRRWSSTVGLSLWEMTASCGHTSGRFSSIEPTGSNLRTPRTNGSSVQGPPIWSLYGAAAGRQRKCMLEMLSLCPGIHSWKPIQLTLHGLKQIQVAEVWGHAEKKPLEAASNMRQESSAQVPKAECLTAKAAQITATLPKGWIAVPNEKGVITYYNAQFQGRAATLVMDPNADEDSIKDPFALSRLWQPSGMLFPWCSYCKKWLDPVHRASIAHVKALSWQLASGQPWAPSASSWTWNSRDAAWSSHSWGASGSLPPPPPPSSWSEERWHSRGVNEDNPWKGLS